MVFLWPISLRQEILRIMAVATGDEGASPSAEAPQGLAPSTPASSPSDVELESGEEGMAGKTDRTVDDTVTMHSFIL